LKGLDDTSLLVSTKALTLSTTLAATLATALSTLSTSSLLLPFPHFFIKGFHLRHFLFKRNLLVVAEILKP